MSNNKVCFISCVNNYEEYNMALLHIHSLRIPGGYEIETIAIENAASLTSGYNEAMRKTDAKYKVYLHQDTYIINKNFLFEIIALFQRYPKLGMMGAIGSKTIPYGCMHLSQLRYGVIYHTFDGKGKISLGQNIAVTDKDYEPVRAIDGMIMITQYDIPWREDIFKGWHCYDISQSLEFQMAGFEVGIPKHSSPWYIHDCGIITLTGFEENRKILVQHYYPYTI
ncbi:glycosyltransferase family protein [Bacillus benzoevorans]|uniref:Streptomycin biosynthesis protein StrF domain-containing protein n=2 Tax=Bacillus benzoevorans TaxID=1456 RepID=A0A7X0HR04_9BACI|nr:glycosyltransferase family protein [Bacillus benzoevorans]MBB6445209.1 hypothetical protein [Bacillus benzoevorans]